MGIWSTKKISDLQESSSQEGATLRRALTAWNLTLLGVGGVIGAGIFVITGKAAATCAGPAVVLSFVISGIACMFAGLCYAEFASMIPIAGSAYTYAYATLGELIAWIIGWDLILEYLFGASTVAVGWAGYLRGFLQSLNLHLPDHLMQAPFVLDDHTHILSFDHWGLNLPAMALVGLMTTLLVIGVKESARFNNVIVAIKVAVILIVICLGFAYVKPSNWQPFIPPSPDGQFGHFGWSGIARGAGFVFFAYVGFDAVSTTAQEAKNPQRDMPIGILGSLAICTVLYVLMTLVMTGLVHYTTLNDDHPVFTAISGMGPSITRWLGPLISIAALAGLASVVLVLLMGQPRIFYSMANDKLLPPIFASVHPRFRTPWVTTIVTGSVSALLAGFFPVQLLEELVSIGTLGAFVIVCAGVWVLRIRQPHAHRPFRAPLVPLVPILGIVSCLAMMASLPLGTWLRFLGWLAVGLVLYFGYSRHRSPLRNKANGA
jgi:APA family basic amino acid/polyamine antiporter